MEAPLTFAPTKGDALLKMRKAVLRAFAEGALVRPASWRKQALRWDRRGIGAWRLFPETAGGYGAYQQPAPTIPRPEECLMPWEVVTEEQVMKEVYPQLEVRPDPERS
jgi:hypothetical protein